MNESEKCAKKDLAHIWHPASQMKDYEDFPPIIIDHGKGVKLYDVDGKEYIDIISSWWCNLLGHCNDEVSDALKSQVDKLDHVLFANFSHKTLLTTVQHPLNVHLRWHSNIVRKMEKIIRNASCASLMLIMEKL